MSERDTVGVSDSVVNKGVPVFGADSPRKGTWLLWTLTTILGAMGGSAAFQSLNQMRFTLAGLVALAAFAIMIGIAQSLVLARVFCKSDRLVRISFHWTLACLTGWGTGGVASMIITMGIWLVLLFTGKADYTWTYRPGAYVQWVSLISIGTFSVSIVQQYVLQLKFRLAGRWIWASVIGWFVGWTAGLVIAYIVPGSEMTKGVAGGAVGGAVLGAVTGRTLVRLLTDPRMLTEP